MSVVTISRGTFSGGKMLAECLGRTLGFRCIDRDMIVEKAAGQRVSQQELRAALEEPPGILGRLSHKRYIYLALIQATLTEEVRNGRAVYHGLAGHLLLRGAPGMLRLRIIAPMEFRIRMAGERMNLTRSQALAHIEKMDQHRRKWTQFLYGVNWEDASLYDLVINLEHTQIEEVCEVVAAAIEQPSFQFTPECQAAWSDLALASRLRAALALNPFTANLEVQVESRGCCVTITGEMFEQTDQVRRVAGTIPGISGLTVEDTAPPAETWPWNVLSTR